MREVKITFAEVKDFIKENCKYPIDEMIDVTKPFAMDYIKYPFGYAETDNLNDIQTCVKDINEYFISVEIESDGRVRRGVINHYVKKEKERWASRNAWGLGRHIGRLAYLLNKEVK